jgi:hypothetical protein
MLEAIWELKNQKTGSQKNHFVLLGSSMRDTESRLKRVHEFLNSLAPETSST